MPIIEALPETSIAIDNDVFTWIRNKKPRIQELLFENFRQSKIYPAIPSVVIFETMYGFEKELKKGSLTQLQHDYEIKKCEELFNAHPIIDLNRKAAEIAAYVRAQLGESKSNGMRNDILIVATAIAHNFGLASGNKKHMEEIANNLPANNNILRLAVWRP